MCSTTSIPTFYPFQYVRTVNQWLNKIVIRYMLLLYTAPPPAPIFNDFIISFGESSGATTSFNFAWDSSFNSRHSITSYRVVPAARTGTSMVQCPPSCSPGVPCQCTGLLVGEQVKVNISAINCDDQEGPVRIVTISSCKFRVLYSWLAIVIASQYSRLSIHACVIIRCHAVSM